MSPYAWLAAVVIAAVTLGGTHWKAYTMGERTVQADWNKTNADRANAEKAAILTRDKQNAADAAKQQAGNGKITKAKDEEIDKLRTDLAAAKRMRVGPSLCPRSASQADTPGAGSGDATNTAVGLVSESTQRSIDALIMQVEEALSTGRACQAFVTNNGMGP